MAATSLDGVSGGSARNGNGNGKGTASSGHNTGSGGHEASGVGGAVRRGARQVVEVVPAYMWVATSTLMALTLLFAAATWLLAGRARQGVRRRPPALADAGALPASAPVVAPVPVVAPRGRGARPPAGASAAGDEPRLYDGEILLTAGPFGDMDELADFERRLAALPLVDDVRVGHFEGDRVLINLRLTGPTDLAQQLSHEFGPSIDVTSTGPSELVAEIPRPGS